MAHVVGGRASRRGVAPGCPEVRESIGRVAPAVQLAGASAGAGTGKPATWLLAGEGGMGKTRLATELTTIGGVGRRSRPAGPVSCERAVAVPATAGGRDRRSPGRAVAGGLRGGACPPAAGGALAALLPELSPEVPGTGGCRTGQPEVELRRICARGGDGGAGAASGSAARLLVLDDPRTRVWRPSNCCTTARHCAAARLLVLRDHPRRGGRVHPGRTGRRVNQAGHRPAASGRGGPTCRRRWPGGPR